MKRIENNDKAFILGLLMVIFAVLAICFSTVARFLPLCIIAHYVCEVVALGSLLASFETIKKTGSIRIRKELALLILFTAVIGIWILIRSIPVLITEGKTEYLGSMILVVFLLWGIVIKDIVAGERLFYQCIYNMIKKIQSFVAEHMALFVLILGTVLCAVMVGGNQPRWDSAYLFRYLNDCSIYSIFYVPQLSFISHINFSYSALNLIAELLAGDLWLGMTVLNIGLFALSGFSFYGIMIVVIPNCPKLTYILGTAVYLWSPFLFGMVNNNYWDYWVVCLLPIILFLMLKQYWVLESVVAFLFCFVKETAVVVYAFICLGVLICQMIEMDKKPIKEKILCVLRNPIYYVMLLTGLIWAGFYFIMPNWNGDGGFRINVAYIVSKLYVYFCMNFNWIFTLAGLLGLVAVLVQKVKESEKLRWILPLMCGDLAYLLFSCLFVTVNHARYIGAHVVILYIFGIFGLCMIQYDWLRNIILALLATLMIFQSFYTVDPVTRYLFSQYNVGNAIMVSATRGEYLADSMVYNQQYQYFDRALDKALEDVVYRENAQILFPAIQGKTWYFDGFAETTEEVKDYYITTEYWDVEKEMRCILPDEHRIEMLVYNVEEQGDWSTILGEDIGYYFYLDFAGCEGADKIRKEYDVIEETVWEYRGWRVRRIEFTV